MSSKNVIDLRGGGSRPAPQPTLDLPRPRERPNKRKSPVRSRRRRTRLIIAFILLILVGGVAYGVSWASYLPRYSVSTITVGGSNTVPAKLIYDYVETQLYTGIHPFLSKDNIFLYNPGALEREIVGFFPRIASASVSRSSLLATAVTVTVQERQPFALWCSDTAETDCYEMDDTGFIFAQAPAVSNAATASNMSVASSTIVTTVASDTATSTTSISPAPTVSVPQAPKQYVFFGGIGTSTQLSASSTASTTTSLKSPIGQTFVGAHVPGILALLQMLGQAGYTPTGATVENAQDFWVPLTQGFYIKASFGEDPENIVSNLQLVLSSDSLAGKTDQLEYVDLRFGDRVYYKLQGAAETQSPSK